MSKKSYAKRETKEYNKFSEIFQWLVVRTIVNIYGRLFNRIQIEGRENIPKNQSFVVAPTHSSYFDPILAAYATRRPLAFMAKQELFNIKWLCPIILWLGAFAVNRNKLEIATIRTAQNVMKTNHWLLAMFPQGTRDNQCEITKMNPGFAYLAHMAKAQILPISISGFDKYFRAPFSGLIKIKIGKPFDASKDLSESATKWCECIAEMGDFTISQEALDKIEKMKNKEKNESSNTAS